MRTAMCVCGAMLALAQPGARAQGVEPVHETLFERGAVEVEGESYPFRLMRPPGNTPEPAPLVVFLHGAGERGDDNEAQLRHFPERMASAEYRERFPCYLLAVQCPAGERWSDFDWRTAEPQKLGEEPEPAMAGAIEAIRRVVASEQVDVHRIYLTGLSMGGFGSWDLAARHPDWFAAVAPICGGGDPEAADAYEGLPMWAWHDAGDNVVPVALSRRMVEAARGEGADVKYEETTGHGHASWVPAYEADAVPAWMFEQRKEKASEELEGVKEGD